MTAQQSEMPAAIADVDQLDHLLSDPGPSLVAALARVDGDLIVLGVAGKMGSTLATMAQRAAAQAGVARRIIGVSRFTEGAGRVERQLRAAGIEAIRGDLLDAAFVDALPDAANVVYMTGMKFGAANNLPLTWAMNTYVPALVCRRFAHSRIVAFSTGNVYGLTSAHRLGSVETDMPSPLGEYAMSCLGRERIFEHFSRTQATPTAILRLNYATELRYGVLVDLARKVYLGEPIDLSMGYVNVIWQGDACGMALRALADATSPPLILNIAGPERLRVRDVCRQFGELMNKPVRFVGVEAPDALLSDGNAAISRYGAPHVAVGRMIRWVADWIVRGQPTLDKPTHYEVRDGRF